MAQTQEFMVSCGTGKIPVKLPVDRLRLPPGPPPSAQPLPDAAAAFRLGFDQAVPTVPPQRVASGEAFKQRQFGLHWTFQASRTSLVVSVAEFQERYVMTTANDRDSKLANVLLVRQLSPALSGEVGVSYQRLQQVGAASSTGGTQAVADQSAKILGAAANVRWQVGERLALHFIYAYSRQNGIYSENQIGVTASWALIGGQTGLGRAFPALNPLSPSSTQSPYQPTGSTTSPRG